MSKRLFILITLAVLGINRASSAAIVNYENAAGNDFRIASIINLQIGADLYNVDFVHGGTYEEFAAGVTDPLQPITFSTFEGAKLATKLIAEEINALNTDGSTFTSLPGDIRVPWRIRVDTVVDFAKSGRVIVNPIFMSTNISGNTISITSPSVGSGSSTTEWAVFYPVPEPASMSLLAFGGLAMMRRRR